MNENQNPENFKPEGDAQEASSSSTQNIEFPSRAELENQLTAMEMKIDEYKNTAFRAQAEIDNIRKRTERDIENAHKYGVEKLIQDLLPALDSLSRGLEGSEPSDPHLRNMRHGIKLTLDLLEKTLLKHGVRVIAPPKGELFNPQYHQAMSALPDPNAKPNTILEVLQKGYELNGRVLRAAMVIIAQ